MTLYCSYYRTNSFSSTALKFTCSSTLLLSRTVNIVLECDRVFLTKTMFLVAGKTGAVEFAAYEDEDD